LGFLFLLCVLLRITSIWNVRTGSFELLAIGGAALTLAGTLPVEERYPQPWNSALDWLIKSGRFIFAIALVVFDLIIFSFSASSPRSCPLGFPGTCSGSFSSAALSSLPA
jgi:hypothetical protein